MDDLPIADSELLTLQEAADRLKVHYMTAYRWVRNGDLPAFKAGGRLRVRAHHLDQYAAHREVEIGLPSRETQRTDWSTHSSRLHALLVDGASVEAGKLVRKVVSDGASAGDVYLHLIAPALHDVGEDWSAGLISVPVEHRATEIASSVMARLSEHFRRRGTHYGTAVTLTPPGELHGVAAQMVADFLRAGGFDVHHLGPNVPLADLTLFLQVVPADLVCVSMTTPDPDPSTAAAVTAACRDALPDVAVVIGGQAHDPERVRAAGAEPVAELEGLTDRAAELVGFDEPAAARSAAPAQVGPEGPLG